MSADLDEFYDAFPRIEPAFNAALERSLDPRGPDLLYDLVAGFGLAPGSTAVDVGCGEGEHALRLARTFGLRVVGIDPVPRHVEIGAGRVPERADVEFRLGSVEALPLADASVDLVWCRDVLVHVRDLERAFAEMRRVARPGARILVHHTLAGERLEPREAAWLFGAMQVAPESADPMRFDAAVAASRLEVEQRLALGSEWEEAAEERSGRGTNRLFAAARLLRDPDRYVQQFGQAAYDIMLGDCLWHVYALIGTLDTWVYVLRARPRDVFVAHHSQ